MEKLPFPDRRRQPDRRDRPTQPLTLKSIIGRRKHVRRKEDRLNNPYVDIYSLRSVLTVVCIILLSISDAFFTLELVSLGARELNPVMHFFLTFGPMPFLIAKFLLTVVGVVVFLVHKNRLIFAGQVSVKAILLAVLSLYLMLLLYELTLLLKIEYMLLEASSYSGIGGTPLSNSFTACSRLS
jgi:hypothetical protein